MLFNLIVGWIVRIIIFFIMPWLIVLEIKFWYDCSQRIVQNPDGTATIRKPNALELLNIMENGKLVILATIGWIVLTILALIEFFI